MRNIGTIENEQQAVLAGAYLLAGGVECRVEAEDDDGWQVWVLDEDKLAQGQKLLHEFVNNPDTGRISEAEQKAQQMIADVEKARDDYVKRQVDMRARWSAMQHGAAPVSYIIIGICTVLWVMQTLNPDLLNFYYKWLLISSDNAPFMEEIKSGEFWRLITPALLHAPVTFPGGGFSFMGILHILFNMMWLKDLGPLIERRENSWKLLLMVLLLAAFSNLLQYCVTKSPAFLGFSGVVYGLLAYLWIRGRFDPAYGLRLNPGIIWFMMIWFVLGFTGNTGMANYVHLGGLIGGGFWGLLNAKLRRR